MSRTTRLLTFIATLAVFSVAVGSAAAIRPPGSSPGPKSPFDGESTAPTPIAGDPDPAPGTYKPGTSESGRGGVSYVNDACLDAAWPGNQRTTQSETELAVLNAQGDAGKKIVAGYNDSWGFYDTRQGLSGFAYSTNGGNTWIDGGGLPTKVAGGPPAAGMDRFLGDPVVVVRHSTKTFWYASIYQSPAGYNTLSVSRGTFKSGTTPAVPESESNTACGKTGAFGVATQPKNVNERIVWEPPVEAVAPPNLGPGNSDFLDKEWMYVDQRTGTLYVTYTNFEADGDTPLQMVVSYDGGQTWSAPRTIVPNLLDTFNQATMPVTLPSGRVVVTWFSRTFDLITGAELSQRIEYAYSDDDGLTWSAVMKVSDVNPQGEPLGYNRARATILNAPYINVDKGADDGIDTPAEQASAGFGNAYITYFSGTTNFPTLTKAANVFVSRLTSNGTIVNPRVQADDDGTTTTHVFPTVQVNKHGHVYLGWLDRRLDTSRNILTDNFASRSTDQGATFSPNRRQTDVSTSWYTRVDARPNMGDYNSSDLLGFNQFVQTWADGRFPGPGNATCTAPTPTLACPTGRAQATADSVFSISNGLGQ